MSTLVSKNPATGKPIQEIATTPVNELPHLFARAKVAQQKWATVSVKNRSAILLQIRETLLNHVDDLTDLISQENGKPRFEAMFNELFPSVDLLTFYAKNSERILRDKKIPMTLLKHRASYINYWPVGVVAIISPWNYPFLLPFGEIIMALAAGNAIIFKPSEATPLIGLKIQDLCYKAGLPKDLLITVVGDGALGAAMVQEKPAKVFFTGSVATGKKIMSAAAQHLIPVNLELGGKDAMIVLPDADLDYATSAALWGGFSNSGQVCASVERILVHESIAPQFIETLKGKLAQLRQGPSTGFDNDLGAITFEKQKLVYQGQISQAKNQGAKFIAGGEFSECRTFLKPTIVSGSNIEELDIYNEETFGPVVAVSTYKTINEAVEKTNKSQYGLLASVIGNDLALAESVARQLEVGTVTINEVVYTAGLAETPWGGIKNSGIGRTHSEAGLLEFVHVRHIHKPRAKIFSFKSLWWFPYTPFQYAAFRKLFDLYRRSWIDKLRAFPHFLWNVVQQIKTEKRL